MGIIISDSIYFHFPYEVLLVLVLSSSLIPLGFSGAGVSCEPRRCSMLGPPIQFPFRIEGIHPDDCGYPGFGLTCKGDQTLIYIKSVDRQLIVKDIDYDYEYIKLADPNNCVWGLFSHLSTTFNFSSNYKQSYTIVSCPKNVHNSVHSYGRIPVACMSDLKQNMFVLASDYPIDDLAISCKVFKSIDIPLVFPFECNQECGRPYDNSPYWFYPYDPNGEDHINFPWYVPGCFGCKRRGGNCDYNKRSNINATCSFPWIPYHHHHGFGTKQVIIVSCITVFILSIITVVGIKMFYSWKLSKKLDLENQIKVEKFLEEYKSLKPTRYSYADVKRMTNDFKEKLGQGGSGAVFKGKLSNGTLVAIKLLKDSGGDGTEFMNEVRTIGMIHHVNLVRLLGFCADRLKRGLIYEFMPNESLEKFIFSRNTTDSSLSWSRLQEIAIGIARGIDYLHQGCEQRILHFDIKPHNILLDHNFNPKISDFGMAKLCSKGQSMVSMTATRGTMGYIAPEVFSRNFGNASSKSDVFSFGMLLLEIVGGRIDNDFRLESAGQVYFPEWAYGRLCKGEDLGLVFATDGDEKVAMRLTIVALCCIQWNSIDRPCMKNVIQMLQGSFESLVLPSNPFVSSNPTDSNDAKENNQTSKLPTIHE